MSEVVVVDYGMGNLKSVQRALEKVGARARLSSAADEIAAADRLLLPGVGAFKDGMRGLTGAGLVEPLKAFVATGRPLLGICLGMQMLLDESEEHGVHAGLGLIPGQVKLIPETGSGPSLRKIPHIGWNALHERESWAGSLLSTTAQGEYFYFVHSYMAVTRSSAATLSTCNYEGAEIAAVVAHENITGTQFHPEKSCIAGLNILQVFLDQ